MSWEHINLNMTPGGEMPIVHVSQFDTHRAFTFNLFVGEDEWTIPEGIRFELHCRKVDDNIVIIEPDSIDASSVTFITTEQLTACSGKNKCELVAIDTDDDTLIVGSINFILDVEADPLAGGLTSETEIDNLTQQIEDIATEVIGENYYDKTEVDTLLADKADVSDLPDMSNYYTKTATDTLLNAKADAATTYTKSETDALLATKANTADLATVATTGDYDDLLNKPVLPDMSQYYTKSEVDDLIDNIYPTLTASGEPATFTTALTKPLVSVTADPLATTITRCGKNLIDDSKKVYVSNNIALGTETYLGKSCYLPAGTYTISVTTLDGNNTNLYCQDLDDNVRVFSAYDVFSYTFTLSKGTNVSFWVYKVTYTSADDITSAQVELGSTPTVFEEYNGITVSKDLATTINTLTGVNNVFADAGSVTVQYKYMSI